MSFDWAGELFIDPARGKDDNQIIYTLIASKIFTHPETGLRGSFLRGTENILIIIFRRNQILCEIIGTCAKLFGRGRLAESRISYAAYYYFGFCTRSTPAL